MIGILNPDLVGPTHSQAFTYEDGSVDYQAVPQYWRIINRGVNRLNELVPVESAREGFLFNISAREAYVGLAQDIEMMPGFYALEASVAELIQPSTEDLEYTWEIHQGDDQARVPARKVAQGQYRNTLEIQGGRSQALTIAFMIQARTPQYDGYVTIQSLRDEQFKIEPGTEWRADMIITPPLETISAVPVSEDLAPRNDEPYTNDEKVQQLLRVGKEIDRQVKNAALAVAMFEHIAAEIRGR